MQRCAVGIISKDYLYLIACRPRDKLMSGFWEFPGGKIEPSESAYAALQRECFEEVGIEVLSAEPLVTLEYQYPNQRVHLSVFNVTAFSGQVRPCENQTIKWEKLVNFKKYKFLPASEPIFLALSAYEQKQKSLNEPWNLLMTIEAKIKAQMLKHPIILYMKGEPDFPQCGFSAQVVNILRQIGTSFHSIDILQNPDIRAHLPKISDWPTFPQLFIRGELVGGCDIVTQLFEQGELKPMLDHVD